MKPLLPFLLTILLLLGCSADPQHSAPVAELFPAPVSAEPDPTPVGFYDPESALESITAGALMVYPLNHTDAAQIVSMDDGLLLFSGKDTAALTLLTGSDLYVKASANLNCPVQADDPSVQVSEKGVTYYDAAARELVFLDALLKEYARMTMPEAMVGSPALSANHEYLYYCTENALRVMELDTGLDILIREMSGTSHRITALHCSDMVLSCRSIDAYGAENTIFVSTENGRTLWETSDHLELATKGSRYFARHLDGMYPEYLTGTIQSPVSQLDWDGFGTTAYPVLDADGVLLCTDNGQNGTLLEFCQLSTGNRTGLLNADAVIQPLSVAADPSNNSLLMLCYDEADDNHVIYRWNLSQSITDDPGCIIPRHTAENPDQEALARCKTLAAQISEHHGVNVLFRTDAAAANSAAVHLEPEYQAPAIHRWLEELDQLLDIYPHDLLTQLADGAGNPLRICLVRSFEAADPGEDLRCLIYRDTAAEPYLFVTLAESWQTDFHHQLFHVIETHILTTCPTYDSWSSLNPKGFQYTLRYMDETTDALQAPLEEGAFVNLYATSFPKEDRAMTMLAALEPGNEAVFESRTMKAKLKLLCSGIRTAFGYKKSPEVFLWEQYLK